jgi:hypothetical protein
MDPTPPAADTAPATPTPPARLSRDELIAAEDARAREYMATAPRLWGPAEDDEE